jgi:biotin synthase
MFPDRIVMKLHRDMSLKTIRAWLEETEPARLEELWAHADKVRREQVGNEVYFRGLIEISNYCTRNCHYCGIRAGRKSLQRYRLSVNEIKQCAQKAKALGYGTLVLQSGEDAGTEPERIATLVKWIKKHLGLAVTLSLGEQSLTVFKLWKQAGADRYLLRIETTNDRLLSTIHPGEPHGSRKENIERLFKLGFETGSGIMVGIPGQTYDLLAKDLAWFRQKDFDMIGIGPYLPHPDTPLNGRSGAGLLQVPNTELATYKALALVRILCPEANLPATTALATVNQTDGRELALQRGANVIMPNLTPFKYRKLYEIYPAKACIGESTEIRERFLTERIRAIGRTVGKGPGARKKK